MWNLLLSSCCWLVLLLCCCILAIFILHIWDIRHEWKENFSCVFFCHTTTTKQQNKKLKTFNLWFQFFFLCYFQLTQRYSQLNSNLRSIATGSWGCGIQQQGDPQFKVLVQWCAASVANVPSVIYYTCGRESLSKLDTVVRVLQGKEKESYLPWDFNCEILRKFWLIYFYLCLDRKWTVGELLRHTLYYARNILNNPTNNTNFCLFDKLIGLEKGINWWKKILNFNSSSFFFFCFK